jgi:hypothetical protein
MNYAQIEPPLMVVALMKTTELNVLEKLVKAGETRSLIAADLALLLRVRFALQTYQAESAQPVRQQKPGKPLPERGPK